MSTTSPLPIITLHRGWDTPTKYVWSPFVTKLEFRFRTSHLPYTTTSGSVFQAPRGKIPYISLPDSTSPDEKPVLLGDTALIISALTKSQQLLDLNENLSPAQRGQDLAVRALLEDKLYFFQGHERWVKNYYVMRDHAMWAIPWLVRVFVGLLAYRGNVKKFYDQGAGRFSEEEIFGFKVEIWEGVAGLLAESRLKSLGKEGDGEEAKKCYWVLGGEEPTEADATLFGFVVSVLICEAGPESKELLKSIFTGVVDWAERVHWRFFPDYEMW